jgi:hypothetical protein
MKNITLLSDRQVAALLLSLDDLRSLLETIVKRSTFTIPDPDPWDRDISDLALDEIF